MKYYDHLCGCGCGGRIKVQKHHKYHGIPEYLPGHQGTGRIAYNRDLKLEQFHKEACLCCFCKNKRNAKLKRINSKDVKQKSHGNLLPREIRTCLCGCSITFECKVNSTQKYIWGHHRRNKKQPTSFYEKTIGRRVTKEAKERYSIAAKRRCQNPEYWRKRFLAQQIKPNKPERGLDVLLQKLFPNEWKFVGDGEFILASKCPDFVNINGQKKIIELFGDYWHGEGRTGVPNEQHEQERIDLFAQYGYQTLIVWEHELYERILLEKKLVAFNQNKRKK